MKLLRELLYGCDLQRIIGDAGVVIEGIHLNSKGHQWIFERIISWDSINQWADKS